MVSVIMPCYNAGKYIREAIQSVQSQTYKDWELLVIDDGSTDDSAQIAQELARDDNRIRLIQQPNSGACRARNNGIENAQGEFVKFLDADDILLPVALQDQVGQISTLEPMQIPFGDYDNVDEWCKLLSEYHFDQCKWLYSDSVFFFFCYWRILISCPLHRLSILKKVGGFDESLARGQEANLHLRLALADVEWIYFPTKIFQYREYEAEHRISCSTRQKSKKMILFREQRLLINEKLLCNKYGDIPAKYYNFFRKGWFDRARRAYADKDRNVGDEAILKMQKYVPLTRFQRFYIAIGRIVGYVFLEQIFMLRIKLLGKELK